MKHYWVVLFAVAALAACGDQGKPSAQKVNEQAQAQVVRDHKQTAQEDIPNFDEKVDVLQIGLALRKAGAADWQGKEREWKRQMAAAKTGADIQAVFADQLRHYRSGAQALEGLEMRSAQGREVHRNIKAGFDGIAAILQSLQTLDLDSAEGLVRMNEMSPQIIGYANQTMQGMQGWMDMMKKYHHVDKAAEEKFNRKMREIQEMNR